MAKRQQAIFREARPAPPFWALRFTLATPPAPGTFVLADLGGPLRAVLFPAGLVDSAAVDAESFTVLLPPGHPATQLLPGATVDILGPLGHGFRIDAISRLLLVAEMPLLPPLLPLLQSAPAVTLVVEATTRALLPPVQSIPESVELCLVTRDGSAGYLGPLEVEDTPPEGLLRAAPRLLELLAWAERACFSCTPGRYPDLAQMVHKARLYPQADFAQSLVQVPMPCGVGACEVCRVKTRRGEQRACVDGPVFDLLSFMH